jgi:hypothetical protein
MALSHSTTLALTPDLAAAVTAALDAMANTTIIVGFQFDLAVSGKRIQPKAVVSLLLETGGVALTGKFQCEYFQATSAADLDTAINTFLIARGLASDYVTAPIVKFRVNDNGDFDQLYAVMLWSTDAAAATNFLPRQ